MKTFLLATVTFLVLALSAFADPTPTNSVKGSALSLATTPLAGTELVYMIQAGATKTVTAAQLNAAAIAQDTATSNSFALTRSDFLRVSNNDVTISNNYVVTSNTVAAMPAAIASSNFTSTAQIKSSNFLSNVQVASSNFLNNVQVASSNFQSGAQVTATVNAAVAGATLGTVTNNGVAILNTLTASNIVVPTAVFPTITLTTTGNNINLDCSVANLFLYNVTSTGGSWDLHVRLTNFKDGQQIYAIVKINSGSTAGTMFSPITYAGFNYYGTQLQGSQFTSGDTWFFNWIVVGNNVVFSGTKL
ncbi:MAG TPA: hypothetical protein VG347_01515 [Verrucomicrobiae bacterium]|nr:hypothetical protein [Verrucomicrobiae bacterium]